jgi:16S rRNA processing protein RimM
MADDRILIGVVSTAHGLRGDVKVKSYLAEAETLKSLARVVTGDGQELALAKVHIAGASVRVHFTGIDDRTAAEALRGQPLFIDRVALPAPDGADYYHADLLGCRVVDENGNALGTVTALYDFGAGDIVEFGAHMVPFTEEFVPVVDLETRQLTVRLPVYTDAEPEPSPDQVSDQGGQ